MDGDIPETTRSERLSARRKVSLIFEILGDYVAMLRVLGDRDVLRLAARARAVASRERIADPHEHRAAQRLGKAVGRTLGVLPTDSRCLIRSLVLVRVLARRSIPSTLVIGVRRNSEFEAHAWVEHEGEAILPAGEYTRLTEL
ncbi:MAG TPA: lasso peptide biosynthesis B2 protein [Gemmatimonadota bacterium]